MKNTKPWTSRRLLAVCYGALAALWLLWCVGCFAADRLAGTQPQALTLADFDLVDLRQTGDSTVVAVSADPQMILKTLPGRAVSLSFTATYTRGPGAVELYTARAGADFSLRGRHWPVRSGDSWFCALPRFGVGRLRLDPSTAAGTTITFSDLTLNARRGFLSYFAVSRTQVFWFAVLPAFAAAALRWLAELLRFLSAKKGMR